MKIIFLGQAGLLFEWQDLRVMIDPYLSNEVEKINPQNDRRQPIDERFFAVKPNVMIFTHNHLDHYDPQTVGRFVTHETAVTVLSPQSVWQEVRKLGGKNNYVLFNRHTSWTEKGVRFTAVKAEHSDPTPIGVVIEDGEKTYYITGDTLYNEEIFKDLPSQVDVLFLPVNGVGNNMNFDDAARFARRVGASAVVPLHTGLFDDLDLKQFPCKNKIIPEIYKEIVL